VSAGDPAADDHAAGGNEGPPDPASTNPPGSGRPDDYPFDLEADVLLADGAVVAVRPIVPSDAERLLRLHGRLSEESRYLRFFSPLRELPPSLLRRFVEVDYVDRLALVALLGDEMIGVARYDRLPGGDEAEVAFVVDDAHQGRGIATVLLEHLAAAARARGIGRFVAETLPHNRRMLGVFSSVGFLAERSLGDGVVTVTMEIAPTAASQAAMRERERRSAVRSIARLLAPRTVAVLGASREPGSLGRVAFDNLLAGGFTGVVYPVNPAARSIGGVRCYASLADLPEPVDVAIVAVPAPAVPEVVTSCGRLGVGSLVVLSAGFAEEGAAGAARERELVRLAHRFGMRVVGPNCMGVAHTDPAIRLNATLSVKSPLPGHAGLLAQSGALGLAILEEAHRRGVGISSFVSAGNKADVSGNDLLQYWEEDPATQVALLYLETFGNPRTFARVARRVSRRKPIVAVKAGRESLLPAGGPPRPDEAVEALFRHTGVLRVATLEQLLDVAKAFATQPLPAGRRVALLGHVGGALALAADACVANGLELAAPTASGPGRLVAPGIVALPPDASEHAWEETAATLLTDPRVDALLACYIPTFERRGDSPVARDTPALRSSEGIARALRRAQQSGSPLKPLVANFLVGPEDRPDQTVANYDFPEAAAFALARLADYAAWLTQPPGATSELADDARTALRQWIAAHLHREAESLTADADLEPSPTTARKGGEAKPEVALGPAETRDLLALAGLRVDPGDGIVAIPAEAREAEELAFTVVRDPSFGHLVLLETGVGLGASLKARDAANRTARRDARPGGRLVRVLPLTDTEVAEVLDALALSDTPPDAAAPRATVDPGEPSSPSGPSAYRERAREILTALSRLIDNAPEVASLEVTLGEALDPGSGGRSTITPGPLVLSPDPGGERRRLRR